MGGMTRPMVCCAALLLSALSAAAALTAQERDHVQLFVVSDMLSLPPAVSREALLAALSGRVIAAGELVVTFQAPLNAR
jgi:hypothetical protein